MWSFVVVEQDEGWRRCVQADHSEHCRPGQQQDHDKDKQGILNSTSITNGAIILLLKLFGSNCSHDRYYTELLLIGIVRNHFYSVLYGIVFNRY